MNVLSRTFSLFAALCLAGCFTAPTRDTTPSEFKETVSGQVRPALAQHAVDCIMDGFDASSLMMTNVYTRQQRRVGGYRVELLTGPSVLLSVDVGDDGRVVAQESSAAGLINLDKEHAALRSCLAKLSQN